MNAPSPSSMRRPGFAVLVFVFSSLCSLCLCGETRAALDPEIKQPYRLRVVLGIAENRLLTPVFQERVERELRDGLQAALGDVAVVEVVRQHPRLKDVERNGLESLGSWTEVDGIKTHFVLINYVNGEYEIQARQHDGLTGLCSPVVRRERLPDSDRELVARTAALLIGRDFGPVGTVIEKTGNDTVNVVLKASGLGGMPDRRVKKGDVFWLVQVRQGAGGLRGEKVQWALLQAEKDPENGVCPCAVYNRFRDPLAEGSGVLGYRCLGISTIQAPLRLRLVQPPQDPGRPATPLFNQTVYASHRGFSGEDPTAVQGTTDPEGYFSTEKDGDRGLFQNIAFVTVGNRKQPLVWKLPVELVDERVVVAPVEVRVGAGERLTALRDRDLWVSEVYQSLLDLATLFKGLEGTLKAKQSEEALRRAQAGLDDVRKDIGRLEQRRHDLEAEAKAAGLRLDEGDERLKELRAGQTKLEDFVAKLQKRLQEENDPKRRELQDKVARAQLLEDEADYAKALELYKEVLDAGVDNPQLRQHYDKLKAEWEPKNDQDREARAFVYDTWPKAEPQELNEYLPKAEKAYQTCHAVGDVLTERKLLREAVQHAARLKKAYDALQPDVNEEDRDKAKLLDEAAGRLGKLIKDVTADVEKPAPAPGK